MSGAAMPRPGPAAPVRLVLSDIDGTLVNRAKQLTPRARAAIAALDAAGIAFTVTSARPPAGLRPIIDLLGLKVPVAAVNGGAIIAPDLTIIEEKRLPPAAGERAIDAMRARGIEPWLFTAEAWYIRDPAGAYVEHEARTIAQRPIVVDAFTPQMLEACLKIVGASHDHPHLAETERQVQDAVGAGALATRSQAYYLDVTHPLANKGEGVHALARAMGIPPVHILTIGDGANDVPMFRESGFSIAMGHAEETVTRAAMVVTDDCEHDGFAKAVERYVLGAAA